MTETRPRVLVVDDDLTVSEVVSRYLEREGYDWIRAKYPDAASAEDELEQKSATGQMTF